MPVRTLVLASASTARLELLRAAGLSPRVIVSGVDEDGIVGHDAPGLACALAERKADAVAARLAAGTARTPVPPLVLGCDSVLDIAGEVRGKPRSAAEARAWCRGYRGRQGRLVTGHALIDLATGRRVARASGTVVRFGRPSDAEVDAYVATGEPLGVAGGFTLDGYAAPFVDGIDGDHGTVIGVSLPLLRTLLSELDIAVTDLWRPT